MSTLRDRLEVALTVALLSVSARLPDRWRSRLGRGLGALAYRFLPKQRRVVVRNLGLCFPDWSAAQREALLRAHFSELGEAVMELGLLWRGTPERVAAHLCEVEGEQHLQAALTQGKGVILYSAHLGSWEAGLLYLPRFGPVSSLYMPTHNPDFSALMTANRARFGTQMLAKNKGLRPVLNALRQGRMVTVMADQNVDIREGVFAPFFGVAACTSTSVGRLSQSSGAPVLCAFCYRLPEGRGYRLVFLPTPTGFLSGDDVQDVSALHQILESAIAQAPAQYWWVHRRFKDRPEGTEALY